MHHLTAGRRVPKPESHRPLVEILARRLPVHHLDPVVFLDDELVGKLLMNVNILFGFLYGMGLVLIKDYCTFDYAFCSGRSYSNIASESVLLPRTMK